MKKKHRSEGFGEAKDSREKAVVSRRGRRERRERRERRDILVARILRLMNSDHTSCPLRGRSKNFNPQGLRVCHD